MEDTRKTVLAGNGEKDVPRAVYDGVLTIDVDAQVESMEEQEEARWHQLLNAHRTRKILTGQLRGIEKLESGWMVAVTYFNGFRIIIPMNEMMINLQGDGRENADTLNRQVRIAILPVIHTLGHTKKVCVPWEPWLTAICVISGSKHTELWMQSGKMVI